MRQSYNFINDGTKTASVLMKFPRQVRPSFITGALRAGMVSAPTVGLLVFLLQGQYIENTHLPLLVVGAFWGFLFYSLILMFSRKDLQNYYRKKLDKVPCEIVLEHKGISISNETLKAWYAWDLVTNFNIDGKYLIFTSRNIEIATFSAPQLSDEERATQFGEIIQFWRDIKNHLGDNKNEKTTNQHP